MKIQQKKFVLASTSGNPIKKSDVLILVINDVARPDVPINRVFKRPKIEKDSIEGWSILSVFRIDDGTLVHESLKVFLRNQTTGEDIAIVKIKTPLFQMNDKEFTAQEVAEFERVMTSSIDTAPTLPAEALAKDGEAVSEEEIQDLLQIGYKKQSVDQFTVLYGDKLPIYVFSDMGTPLSLMGGNSFRMGDVAYMVNITPMGAQISVAT